MEPPLPQNKQNIHFVVTDRWKRRRRRYSNPSTFKPKQYKRHDKVEWNLYLGRRISLKLDYEL